MNESMTGAGNGAASGAAHRVAGGLHSAIEQTEQVACRAQDGVTEVRAVIRGQPITAALVVFALGYLFGRLGALIPGGGRR